MSPLATEPSVPLDALPMNADCLPEACQYTVPSACCDLFKHKKCYNQIIINENNYKNRLVEIKVEKMIIFSANKVIPEY